MLERLITNPHSPQVKGTTLLLHKTTAQTPPTGAMVKSVFSLIIPF